GTSGAARSIGAVIAGSKPRSTRGPRCVRLAPFPGDTEARPQKVARGSSDGIWLYSAGPALQTLRAMRIGVFSDVHANYPALCAVVGALRREGVDVSYCLGDVVGYGGSPAQCIEVVRSFAQGTVVGNHDAAVAGRMDYSYYYEAAR